MGLPLHREGHHRVLPDGVTMNRAAGIDGMVGEEGRPNRPVSCLNKSLLLGEISKGVAKVVQVAHPAVLEGDLEPGMDHLPQEVNGVLRPHLLHLDSFLPGAHHHRQAMVEEDFLKELLPASSALLHHRLLQEDLVNRALEPPCLHQPLVPLKVGQLPQGLQLPGVLLQAPLHLQDPDLFLLPPQDEELHPQCLPTGHLKGALEDGKTNPHQEDRMSCQTFWVLLLHHHHQVKNCGVNVYIDIDLELLPIKTRRYFLGSHSLNVAQL